MSLSSPFDQWLGTNYTPSTAEVSRITIYLEEPRSELAALDDEVNEALRALNNLLAKQARLKRHIEAHEALTHPIRRLPDELLVETFHHCLPTSHHSVMSNTSAPLLLTRVCHPWRELALSTPTLWSSLHIPIPRGRNETHHIAVTDARDKGVKWWLTNAKDAPLSVSLFWPPTLVEAYDTECQLLKTVLSHSSHLHVLELNLPDNVLLEMFLHGDSVDLPVLDKVVLRLPAPPDQATRGEQIAHAHLWRTSSIKRLVWESVDDDFFKLPLNWEKMEEIALESDPMIPLSFISPLDARALIDATPNLQRLRLELTIYDQSRSRVPAGFPVSDNLVITMNHLTYLDVTDVSLDPDIETSFLQNLQLPALTSLTYHFMGLNPFLPSAPCVSGPSGPMHPLLAFLHAQDKVAIKYFKVGGTAVPRDAFLECLGLMPLLERLYVTDPRLLTEEDDEYEVDVREPVSDDEGPAGREFPSLDELLATQGGQEGVEETGIAVGEGYGDVSPPARKRRRRAFEDDDGYGRSRTIAARRREISPDDDLLKVFVPSEVWWRTSWEEVTGHRLRETGKWKGKEKETAMDVTDSYTDGVRWDGSPMVIEGRRGALSVHDDEDIEMETEGAEEPTDNGTAPVPTPSAPAKPSSPPIMQALGIDPTFLAPSQSDSLSLRSFPLVSGFTDEGDAIFPEPLGDAGVQAHPLETAVPSIRIPVPIPVDTTDLAAEEGEVLCPRLTSLRFDRARFTVTGLRTFIKARASLSQASSSRKSVGWELVTKDNAGKVDGEEARDEAKGDGDSTGFFTAHTTPSGVFSKIGLSREASTSADASLPHPVEQLHLGSHCLSSRTSPVTVAPLQNIQAGIMYSQPVYDIPPPRLTRGEGESSKRANSRLATEMSEAFDVQVVLRFASVPMLDPPPMRSVWGAQDDGDAFQVTPGSPRWGEGVDGPVEHVLREGRLEESPRGDGNVGVMTAVNDARIGVRGWVGLGSMYVEEERSLSTWEW